MVCSVMDNLDHARGSHIAISIPEFEKIRNARAVCQKSPAIIIAGL